MELDTDEASLCADSNSIDEIDLYDDLMAFSNLSPEEQEKESAKRLINKSEPVVQSSNQFFYVDPVASNESILESVIEQEDRSFEILEQSSFDEESSNHTIEDFPFEQPNEPAIQKERESSFKIVDAGEPPKKKSDYLDLSYLLRVTGPLVALGVTANAASSLLVCRDCGSQASSEDMFCVTCGGLLDEAETSEAAAVVAIKSACEACGSPVEEDEIFCPSCGTVLDSF